VAPDAGRGRALVIGGIVGLVLLVLVAGFVAWRRSRRHSAPAAAVEAPAAAVQTWTAWYAPGSAPSDDSPTVVWTPAEDTLPPVGRGATDAPPADGAMPDPERDRPPEPPPPPA